MNPIVANRHDILVLFDVANGNPNGDPDAGNMPRIEPNTNKGIVSDVCLKRKIRNYVELFAPTRNDEKSNGYNVMIKQGAVIETEQKRAIAEVKDHNAIGGQTLPERVKNWICREFYDVRTFGCVISTGDEVMKGSAFGQIRGPVQFTFGQSFHSITPLEAVISVCAARNEAKGKDGKPPTEEDIAKSIVAQTGIQGRKHFVPYALYATKCYISPPFAEKTGFSEDDLSLFFEALNQMFTHDRSAARGEMVVRGVYDFEHVGSQHPNNAAQNKKEARLGCYHAHKLFEGIQVNLKTDKVFPESFQDYKVDCQWSDETLPPGVALHLRHEMPCRSLRRATTK